MKRGEVPESIRAGYASEKNKANKKKLAKTALTKTCKTCGKEFMGYINYRYCSDDCQWKKKDLITVGEYNRLVREQGGKCVICDKERTLVVDHCHTTMKFRGLLCKGCNASLSILDDLEMRKRVFDYLQICT